MALKGQVKRAPVGVHGFDANAKISSAKAKEFADAGFGFCIRYLTRAKANQAAGDLSSSEADGILSAGLALMAVQHVSSVGWLATPALGTTYGRNAVANAQQVGFPAGVSIWLDLEGVGPSTSPDAVIGYCNAWFHEVEAAGYATGIYVGAGAIISGDDLYWRLKTQHYWKSGSNVPDIPHRGYQMIQRIVPGDKVAGIEIDRNVTRDDGFAGAVAWLVRG